MNLFDPNTEKEGPAGSYRADSIEVLKGLDPVKRRPGMYTDTTSPDHLVFEVIDNSVDEAIAGFADTIEVVLTRDNAIIVIDNGRGFSRPEIISDLVRDGKLGWTSMQERVTSAGGTLAIESQPGEGTSVSVVLPI